MAATASLLCDDRGIGSIWGYPTILVLHTAGFTLVVGSALVVSARLLGMAVLAPLSSFELIPELQRAARIIPTDGRPASGGHRANLLRRFSGPVGPNANLIFGAEGDDPAAVARDAKQSASTNPLTGLYGGWQAVENSSLALLESADLLNLSGRTCADGAPVPVDESQWKAEVEALRVAARATAAAASARSRTQISETAGQLADACTSCHRIYRRAQNHGVYSRGGVESPMMRTMCPSDLSARNSRVRIWRSLNPISPAR